MDEDGCSRWTAMDITLDAFLARAKEEAVASFELMVHPKNGNQDCLFDVYRLFFCLDAVGYRQEAAILAREGDFLRAIAFEDGSCRRAVPLISTSPWRPLMQEIAMRAERYTGLCDTTLHIALPWQEVQTCVLQPQETMESIYARLGEIEEGRKVQVW